MTIVESTAQWLSNALQERRRPGRREGRLDGVATRGLAALRRQLAWSADPPVTAQVGSFEIELPLSHDLPQLLAAYPGYSRNLADIAEELHRQHPAGTMVDIGANVGDSAALVLSRAPLPMLCLEPDPVFFPYLERNRCRIDPELIRAVPAAVGTSGPVSWERERGTARSLASGPAIASLAAHTADDPRFASPRLVKIDTDGFDLPIIEAELEWLARVRPLLFFEFDVRLYSGGPADALALLERLRDRGYAAIAAYDNFGGLLMARQLDRAASHDVVALAVAESTTRGYLDVAVAPAELASVLDAVIARERMAWADADEVVGVPQV